MNAWLSETVSATASVVHTVWYIMSRRREVGGELICYVLVQQPNSFQQEGLPICGRVAQQLCIKK